MGNRISIQFVDEDGLKSPVLFSHSDGENLLETVRTYLQQLLKKAETKKGYPLYRLEAQTVMVDFIRYLTKDLDDVDSNYYITPTARDGDNFDHGHHIFFLQKSKNNYFEI